MEWSKRKFQGKVNEKIFGKIALSQVELATKIDRVKEVLGNMLSLYTKLCDPALFTQEVGQKILRLEDDLKLSSRKLSQNHVQTEEHFHSLLHTQSRLAVLIVEEANIRAKLINIQASLTPHMEILQKELAYVNSLLQKDPNLSTLDSLVHLAAKTTIQLKSLDIALDNWDAALKHIMVVHKIFLDKYLVSVQTL